MVPAQQQSVYHNEKTQTANTFSFSCQSQIHGENIEIKGQDHTEVMDVHDTLYHGDTLT